jgi:hypothetical protein
MAETCSSSLYIRKSAIILKQTELYVFIARKLDDFQLSLHLHNIFHLILRSIIRKPSIRATRLAHLIILDFTVLIYTGAYKWHSSSLCIIICLTGILPPPHPSLSGLNTSPRTLLQSNVNLCDILVITTVMLMGEAVWLVMPWRLMNIRRRFRSTAAPSKVSNYLPIDTA